MSLGRTFSIGSSKIPAVGLGTWQSEPGKVRAAVAAAIGCGYRHIDAAAIYGNQDEVGQGIKDAGVAREKLWITSKLWNSMHSPENVEPALDQTLKELDLKYLDLYLMHWPVAFGKGKGPNGKGPAIDWTMTEDIMPTWRAMEKLVDSGKVKHIGISNFTIARAKKLLEQARIKPAANQVEVNLKCAQPELVKWSKENGILLQAYSPLGSTGAPQLEDEVVKEIAKAHSVDPANILISWQVARGLVVLPKSVTPSRIESNFKDVELTKEEVEKLEARAKELGQTRTVDPSKPWGVNIFDDSRPTRPAKL